MARDTAYRNTPAGDTSPMVPREMRRQEFGRNLWQLLLKRGMTQSDLSRASGLGRDSVSGYVRGRNLPEPTSAKKLADALGVTMEDLYPGSTERAIDGELPAFEMKQAAGHPGRAWVRVNRMMSFAAATKIAAIIEQERE
jgi:transcriptional regulator with XRE-family HTH domain